MKKALTLVAILAFVGSASAAIQLYLAPASEFQAITDNSLRFNTNETNFFSAFAGTAAANTTVYQWNTAGQGKSDVFYLYGKFDGESPYAQLYAMNLTLTTTGSGLTIGQNLMYRHNKTNGTPSQKWDRWDGDAPISLTPEGTAVAVTSAGIQFYQPGDGSYDLYKDADGTFLIGAFELTAAANANGTVRLGVGSQGMTVRDDVHTNPNFTYFPQVTLNGAEVQGMQYNESGAPGVFGDTVAINAVPEPASMLLLALAGLALRRR